MDPVDIPVKPVTICPCGHGVLTPSGWCDGCHGWWTESEGYSEGPIDSATNTVGVSPPLVRSEARRLAGMGMVLA